ncbi:hypothetical protein K9N68_04705 [Kovacikia minuta CCNUW1]|uniref:hypothetical protein n=1 Tax=Kovacikia minuta TaxID=2931930 RepID=UPI001CC8F2DC|nr:hypothetical protein [Kovacikia minuta]UBF27269.1 hypothetical protein K9N68_04705 [Kovacikia minuta CCNUW1]
MSGNPSIVKALPVPLRKLLRPMLFIALGLHALLLFAPLSSEQKPKPKQDEKAAVKITQLPKAAAPKLRPQIKRQLPKAANRPKSPVPAASPKPATPGGAPQQNNPFADFPHFSPSTPDCFDRGLGDNCRIAPAGIAAVADHFKKALPAKKYQMALETDSPGRKVLRFTKGGKQGYLTILDDAPTTVYILAEQPVKDLEALRGAVVVPPELYQMIAEFVPEADPNDPSATNTAKRENFAQPELFFKPSADPDAVPEGRPNLDGNPSIVPGDTPDSLYQRLNPQLKGIFEEVSPVGNFGNGPLYQLKKGSTRVYLSLVPAQGVSGTIISVWLKDPR